MTRTDRWVAGPLCALALLAACELKPDENSDSARAAARLDTAARIDTIVRIDTVFRDRPAPAAAAGARAVPAAGTPSGGGAAAAPVGNAPPVTDADLAYLRTRHLLIPVAGVRAAALPNTFDESRAGGARRHDAIDILAPRGTPVLSTDDGRVARIDTSANGGLSIYAADPSGRFVYYYAHLDAYRPGLRDGQPLARGETLGFVGTTGNAPPGTPHLHFAISLLGEPSRWWDGTAINPFPLLTAAP